MLIGTVTSVTATEKTTILKKSWRFAALAEGDKR